MSGERNTLKDDAPRTETLEGGEIMKRDGDSAAQSPPFRGTRPVGGLLMARTDSDDAWPNRPPPPQVEPGASVEDPQPLRRSQRACYEAFSLALKEGNVFAAMTGPAGGGKSLVMEAVLADRLDRSIRCIRINGPDRVPASLAAQIEKVAEVEAGRPENLERHTVFAIDDAHTSSDELLSCLVRLAMLRDAGHRVPQVLLVGRPELWARLAAPEFEPLVRRIAVRTVLPEAEQDTDPWASVEQDVMRTLSNARSLPAEMWGAGPRAGERHARPGPAPAYAEAAHTGARPIDETNVSPPDRFALFPDAPLSGRKGKKRLRWRPLLLVPALGLVVAVVAFVAVDDLGDLLTGQRPILQTEWGPRYHLPVLSPAAPTPDTSVDAAALQPAPPPRVPPQPDPAPIDAAPEALPAIVQTPAPVIAPPPPVAVAVEPRNTPAAAPVAPVAATAPLSASILALLLRRGDEQAAIGDISAARLLYQRAAEDGSAIAALHLAQTYDPAFLSAADIGTLSDQAAARDWYGVAVVMGSKEAAVNLQNLNRGQ